MADNAVKLRSMSHDALVGYIADYMDKDAGMTTDRAAHIVRELAKLTSSEDREYVLSAVAAFFCRHCGSDDLPCPCMRDD